MAKNFVSNLVIRTKDETTAVVNRVGGAFKSLGGVVTGVAATLATAFSVRSIANFLSGATREAGDFQKQIAIVGNVAGATSEDLKRLRETAEQLGSSTAFSASEAAQGMEALARAGLNAEQTISTIPSVLALAQGQSLELGQAASLITRSLAGMGLEVDQAGRAADVLARGAQSADTNVEGLGQALSYAAPAARALELDLEQTVAMIGKLADEGLDAGRAGTALSNIFLQFKDPASAFRNELRALGIDTEDFASALEQLEAAGEGGEKALLSLGQRGGPALRILVGQGSEAIGELTQKLRESEGTAQSAADTIANTLPGAFAGLRSAWESLRLSLGAALIEPVTRQVTALANKIREFVNSDSIDKLKAALVEGFENGVIAIKEFVAQFGTVEEMANRVTGAISTTSQSFAMLGAAGRAAGNAIMAVFQAVNTVISGLALGISAIVTQIIGVVNILVQSLNAIGLATDSIAMKSQIALEVMQDMNVELAKRTVQAAKDSATALGNMVSAIGDLETGAGRAGTKVAELGTELGNAVANTESAAEAVTRLKGEVEFLTADIDALIESGAGMDLINQKFQELGEAQAKLESAQAAAELEQLATAATDAGNAASGAAQGMTDMAEVLRHGQNVAVDLGGELAKLRQQYDEGKISAKDYASSVAGLGGALQDLTIEQLSREMASLGKQFRDGKITAEELRIATELVTQEMQRQAQAAREARAANNDLAGGNRELAKSYQEVAKSAGEAGQVIERLDRIVENTNRSARRSRPANNYSQWNDLAILERTLADRRSLPKQSTAYHAKLLKDEITQIEDRIKQLKEEKQIGDMRRSLELQELRARASGATGAATQTVRHEIRVGGQTVAIDTAPGQDRAIEQLLRAIEMDLGRSQ